MSDRIQQAWSELAQSHPEPSGVTRRLLDPQSPAKLFAAIRHPDQGRMLLLQLPSEVVLAVSPGLTQMKGVRTRGLPFAGEKGAGFVALSLVEPRLSDLFDVLIADLANELSAPMPPEAQGLTLGRRLEHWRDLFASYTGNELSLSARTGLYGELRWLRFMIEEGVEPATAVGLWQGSPGSDQDFVGESIAAEVKTTVASGNVTISSERQLDETPFEALYLILVAVSAGSEGTTLPEEVDSIRVLLRNDVVTGSEFERRLARVGYSNLNRDLYEDVRYADADLNVLAYEVTEGFPRLTSFSLPPGVTNVTYSLNTGELGQFAADPSAVAALFI